MPDSRPPADHPSDDAVTVIRSEERLSATTARTATERVRIRRVVVTEERTVTVPLRREELVIEREPIDGAGPAIDAEPPAPITFVLHAEELVPTTRVVPVERVSVLVDRIVEMRTVSDSVRKERIDVQTSVRDRLDGDAE
ncbi:YsnF/AvaK domain-containing protein [Rathayibacter sp. Leaf248]|uniref:YsnF/AvaK domain-containing protein n=1 Tax=Rathayibacter sp. Leaf248 TaxID=2876555 RepID=UPI001E520F1A|nr:YsnF/AvaK domain-containing protein [Rathayibacter sp. Leaf248]